LAFTDLLEHADVSVRGLLGGTVTYSPSVGAPVTVSAVFDAAHVRVDLGQISAASSVGPAVFVRLSDLPSDPETDTGARVTNAGVVYTIHEVKPDGLGGAHLLLHRI
jgi:hypothetical protein